MSTPQAPPKGQKAIKVLHPSKASEAPHPKEALKALNLRTVLYPQDGYIPSHYPGPFTEVRNWTEASKMDCIQCN